MYECDCGRSFTTKYGRTNHQNRCQTPAAPAVVPIELHEVRPGDRARHTSNSLDAREVDRIDHKGLWLRFESGIFGPFHPENYHYTRTS